MLLKILLIIMLLIVASAAVYCIAYLFGWGMVAGKMAGIRRYRKSFEEFGNGRKSI